MNNNSRSGGKIRHSFLFPRRGALRKITTTRILIEKYEMISWISPICLSYNEKRETEKSREYHKKGKIKVKRVPQSQTAAHPRHQEEEETDKTKQEQIEQMYGKL